MATNRLERRTFPCAFRVSSDTGKPVIYGYAAKFGVRSDDLGGWVEVIAPTAFDAHLSTSPDVRALFNHDANLILGRTASGTMKVGKDDTGITYEIDPPDTQGARDLMVSMKRGDVSQSSFGFICKDAAWSFDGATGMDVRTVKEAELMDCSPVVFPAYPQATSGVRNLPADMPLEVRSKIAKRDGNDDGAPLDNGCECDCAECQDNRCDACSNPDCVDERCVGNHSRSWRELTELRIQVAQHRAA